MQTFDYQLHVDVVVDVRLGGPAAACVVRCLEDQACVAEIECGADDPLPLDGVEPIARRMLTAVKDQKHGDDIRPLRHAKQDLRAVRVRFVRVCQRCRLLEVEVLVGEVVVVVERVLLAGELSRLIVLHRVVRRERLQTFVRWRHEQVGDGIDDRIRRDVERYQEGSHRRQAADEHQDEETHDAQTTRSPAPLFRHLLIIHLVFVAYFDFCMLQ